jgi:hypothetical protein
MERPGTSNVMSAMPSLSTSILKFSILPILPGRIRAVVVLLLVGNANADGDADREAKAYSRRHIVHGNTQRDTNAQADRDAGWMYAILHHRFTRLRRMRANATSPSNKPNNAPTGTLSRSTARIVPKPNAVATPV